ncbi:MAG: ribonuclease HI family protein, partial [Candidatus Omnitrophica bacterium]|nr:ribonuclease HI family protein [Candidatus Omnitrophota bacterium]
MKSLILCFDGASRPNPGKSACAYVIIDEHSEIIEQAGKFLGEGTNNIAEYLGLILGLLACVKHKPEKLIIYSDSNLVIQQINGKYRVKD